MCAAELRLRTGAHRSVRTRSVTSADDSLTLITATARSTQTALPALDMRRDRGSARARGAGLSSALSSTGRRRRTAPGHHAQTRELGEIGPSLVLVGRVCGHSTE